MASQVHGISPVLFDWPLTDGLPALATDEVRVLRVNLRGADEPDDPSALPLWKLLCDDEQARALRFVRARDRRRFVVCRGSLRLILGQLLDVPAERITFRAGMGGKPEMGGSYDFQSKSALRFNVTHSDELALIALTLGRELGVDLERLRSISEADRIVESYFTPTELAQYRATDQSERAAAFLRGWTRKEAILKAKGVGLAGLATGYETMFGATPLRGQFTPASPLAVIQEWSLWEATPCVGYVAALAIHNG
jgi:4'-phosphopantetheinyl transferase